VGLVIVVVVVGAAAAAAAAVAVVLVDVAKMIKCLTVMSFSPFYVVLSYNNENVLDQI